MTQTWRDLLFAHWPVPTMLLRSLVPEPLALDTFAGEAWVGIVPFDLCHLTFRGAPRRLALGFPELNVRTYVTIENKPGVWFFGLDAASSVAVIVARATYHLPYFRAVMHIAREGDGIAYASLRSHPGASRAVFTGRYAPTGPVAQAAPGSLEHWLTARYCFYAMTRRGSLYRGEITHVPWPLQPAAAEITLNSMAAVHGIPLEGAPLLHFSRQLDIVAWRPERVR
jgi:hypothetical protein